MVVVVILQISAPHFVVEAGKAKDLACGCGRGCPLPAGSLGFYWHSL